MPIDAREETWKKCEEMGIDLVRAKLDAHDFGTETTHAYEWLAQRDRESREQRETEERERAERVIHAAEDSAKSSLRAAQAAKRAAFWTMIAAIGAVLSALCSVGNYAKPIQARSSQEGATAAASAPMVSTPAASSPAVSLSHYTETAHDWTRDNIKDDPSVNGRIQVDALFLSMMAEAAADKDLTVKILALQKGVAERGDEIGWGKK